MSARQRFPHLFGIVPREAELARCLAPGILAAVEVHAPGTAEGEGGTAGVGVFALASAGPAARYNTGQAYRCGLFVNVVPAPAEDWHPLVTRSPPSSPQLHVSQHGYPLNTTV